MTLLPTHTTLDLGSMLGPEWQGFQIRFVPGDGWNLFNPQWRSGFNAGELKAHFYAVQGRAVDALKVRYADAEIERATDRADAAESRAEWYRRQLVQESRLGLMLSQLFETD